MRYRIKRAALVAAVNAALAADSNVPKKARPVTLTATPTGITVAGYGYGETVAVSVPGEDHTGRGGSFGAVNLGRITVEGEAVKLAAKGAPASLILAAAGDTLAVIRGGDDAPTVNLDAVPAETLATMPARMESAEDHGGDGFTVPAGDLAALVAVASKDGARPILTGLAVQGAGDGSASMAATDAYRLAVRTLPAGSITAGPARIIPARLAALALKLAGKGAEVIRITLADDRATLAGDGFIITGRLIPGDYPNYQQLAGDATEVAPYLMSLPTLAAAVATVTATGASAVGIMPGDGSADILAVNPGRGAVPVKVAEVPILDGPDGMPADGFPAYYNAGFLAAALTAAEATGDPVIGWQASATSPALKPGFFGPSFSAGPNLAGAGRSLVMPVRVSA